MVRKTYWQLTYSLVWMTPLTFWWGVWAVRGDLSHAIAVAAESHPARDDGRLAEAHVTNNNHTLIGWGLAAAQTHLHFLEQPFSTGENRIGGQTGHLEEKRLQGDVRRPVWSKAHCIMGNIRKCCQWNRFYTHIHTVYLSFQSLLFFFLQRCYPSNRKFYSSISKWKPLHNATIIFNQQREMFFLEKVRTGSLRNQELQCETPWINDRRQCLEPLMHGRKHLK